jgi:hypothetical protein
MKIYQKVLGTAAVTATVMLISASTNAQGFEDRIKVTFSAPVEVPGEVLPAGTYVFEVLKQGSLTRILSPDELHVYATLLTVPEERREPAEGPAVILKKNNEGGPERVDAWFMPDGSIGNEFVYTKISHRTVGSAVDSSGKKVGHATEKAAKDIGVSTEHVGIHAAHAGEDVGKGVYHAGKFLVT